MLVEASSVDSDETVVVSLFGTDLDMPCKVKGHSAPCFVRETLDCMLGGRLSLSFAADAAVAERGSVTRKAFEVFESDDSVAVGQIDEPGTSDVSEVFMCSSDHEFDRVGEACESWFWDT